MLANMSDQILWEQNATLRQWIHHNRLDGFGRLTGEMDPQHPQHPQHPREAIII